MRQKRDYDYRDISQATVQLTLAGIFFIASFRQVIHRIKQLKTLDSCIRTLLSGIKFSQEYISVAEVGQHKALPLLAVASGCGPSACNASLMQAYASLYHHSRDSALLSGIIRLACQKHAGMTVFKRSTEFKPHGS